MKKESIFFSIIVFYLVLFGWIKIFYWKKTREFYYEHIVRTYLALGSNRNSWHRIQVVFI